MTASSSASWPCSSMPSSFRSILPHEPLPAGPVGYIHVQGAFTPKIKAVEKLSKDIAAGDVGEIEHEVEDTANVEKEEVSSLNFWTKESLEDAIYKILSKQDADEHDGMLLGLTMPLPFSVQQVQVLDPEPPFTKIRLVYESPIAAACIVSTFRQQSVTPAQLFQQQPLQKRNNNPTNDNNNIMYIFSSRPLQWTRITCQPLVQPNSWSHSSPPKFRRLLPRPGEDMSVLEQERQATRFVFITNLLQQQQQSSSKSSSEEQVHDDGDDLSQAREGSNHSATSTTACCLFGENALMTAEAIRSIVNAFDTSSSTTNANIHDGVEIFLNTKKMTQYCHVGMRSAQDAQKLIQGLQGQQVTWKWNDMTTRSRPDQNGNNAQCTATSGKLFLDFAAITHRSAKRDMLRLQKGVQEGESDEKKGEKPRSECTSVTSHVVVPGLHVLENFVSAAEEEVLMAVLTGPHAPWAPLQSTPTADRGMVKRKVQHYGYVFDYQTANVLRDRNNDHHAKCPPMPQIMITAADAPPQTQGVVPSLTVNNATYKGNSETLEEYTERCVREGRGWELLAGVIERTRRHEFKNDTTTTTSSTHSSLTYPNINQITVNHYIPGEGIGSHIDTPSAFGDGLLSITLNGGTVMEFRKVVHDDDDNDEHQQQPNWKNDNNNTTRNNNRKLAYLPPRSLVLMSGPARYSWEHYICSRMTDTHNGQVLPRSLRVSLTLRTALDFTGTAPMPRIESSMFPPKWGDQGNGIDAPRKSHGDNGGSTNLQLATPDCERDHVHAVYDAIATQWHHTRGRRGVLWPGATQFLQRLPPGSIVADVGCGDGKYFPAIWQAGSYVIGTDISRPLLETAIPSPGNSTMNEEEEELDEKATPESRRVSQEYRHLRQYPAVIVADCMSVPLRRSSCDAAICIAVMHHLSTRDRRIQCIRELGRIVRPGGTINIQAWAMEQEEGSRRRFASEDVFVPFNAQPKYLSLNQKDQNYSTAATDSVVTTCAATKDAAEKQKATAAVNNNSDNQTSTAQTYSKAFNNAEYDDIKGLVVFKRYCHLYRQGEMEELVSQVPYVELLESGFESGNHFVILRVKSCF